MTKLNNVNKMLQIMYEYVRKSCTESTQRLLKEIAFTEHHKKVRQESCISCLPLWTKPDGHPSVWVEETSDWSSSET